MKLNYENNNCGMNLYMSTIHLLPEIELSELEKHGTPEFITFRAPDKSE